jgi:hypothetical protein
MNVCQARDRVGKVDCAKAAHYRTSGRKRQLAFKLRRYTCGVFSIASSLMLFVSVAPGAAFRFAVLQGILGGGAIFFAVAGIGLTRFPQDHWCNRSFAVRCLLAVAAITSTMLVLLGVV